MKFSQHANVLWTNECLFEQLRSEISGDSVLPPEPSDAILELRKYIENSKEPIGTKAVISSGITPEEETSALPPDDPVISQENAVVPTENIASVEQSSNPDQVLGKLDKVIDAINNLAQIVATKIAD